MQNFNKEKLCDIIIDWFLDDDNCYHIYPSDYDPACKSIELYMVSSSPVDNAEKLTNYIIKEYGKR